MQDFPEQGSTARLVMREVLRASDAEAVCSLVRATGTFSTAEIALAASLVDDALQKGPRSEYRFLFGTLSERLVGYSCYGAIAATESSFDLYWIVVSPDQQRRGLGQLLLARTEEQALALGGRRLYVETSSRPQYAHARALYQRAGYVLVATLEDFYAPGDHKTIYVKLLGPSGLSTMR